MRCYKCNSALSETDFCNSCGTDVKVYKKIVKMSNTYYNMGLSKAKVRDLSGAADILRRSVRLYKHNIQARNLLGLIYYEMGEFVEALSQWVISKNIQADKNIADDYLKEAQSNPTRLESMNMSIKKYNTALKYANEGSNDLAIIQLKKVLSLNPKFIKGYQLLALLYMQKEEYDKARRHLKKSLAIDYNNTLSNRYMQEIEKLSPTVSKLKDEIEEKKVLSGNDVIIPESSYKDTNYGLMQFLTLIVGVLIGAAMVYFLVMPAKEGDIDSQYKDKMNEYSDTVSNLNLQISDFEKQVSALTTEKESLQAQVDESANSQVNAEDYDNILKAASLYVSDKKVEAAQEILAITDVDSKNDAYKALYNALKDKTFTEAFNSCYNAGYKAENESRYDDAITSLLICEKIQPENVEILYHLGKCYRMKNGGESNEQSKAYYKKVIELDPDSQYAGWSTQFAE